MDRIAIISDIHGNMPALEAVLADIGSRGITRIFCLGDLIGKGPHPEQVVDRVRKACEVVLKGNWEEGTLHPPGEVGPNFARTLTWLKSKLGQERMDYLDSLPFCTEFLMSGRQVRLFHSSAKSIFHRVHPVHALEERLAMFENTEFTGPCKSGRTPDVVGYADIHNAYVQSFQGKTLFNTGSVGNPLEIAPASYAVLEGAYGSAEPASFCLQLVRVPYDIELAVQHAGAEAGMPDLAEYISELRTACYARMKK